MQGGSDRPVGSRSAASIDEDAPDPVERRRRRLGALGMALDSEHEAARIARFDRLDDVADG